MSFKTLLAVSLLALTGCASAAPGVELAAAPAYVFEAQPIELVREAPAKLKALDNAKKPAPQAAGGFGVQVSRTASSRRF
jgi:hypothetical protein